MGTDLFGRKGEKMTLLLTKIFLKSSIQKMNDRYDFNSKKGSITKILLYILLFLYIIAIIGFFSYQLIGSLKSVNQETSFIGLILLMVIGVTVVQTLFSSVNLLYFTKDTDSILPLPLKPYQIILARTNVIILVGYAIDIIGLIPLVIYGVMLNCGIMYYISVILSLILLPILPIILISLLVMIIMSFAKITKNRNRFQLIATLLVIVLTIALSIGVSSLGESSITDEQMAEMMMQANGMVNMIKGYFPTLAFSIDAITSTNILAMIVEFAKMIGITVVSFIIYVLLAQKLYFKGLIGNLYGSSKVKNKKVNVEGKKTTLARSYVSKEFKILFRNPIFLVQCILPALIFPILCIVLVVMGMGEQDAQELAELSSMLEENKSLLLLGILGIIQFFSMIIYVSATAISRDGENAIFMKYIPVSLYKQYVYKTMPNIIMSIISNIIVLAVARYVVEISIIDLLILFIVSTIMSIFQSFLLLLIDLKRPKLKWSSEYAVVKQNLNLMFPMIFAFVNIGIIVLLGMFMQNLSAYVSIAIITIVFVMASVILLRYMKKNQYELARKIV